HTHQCRTNVHPRYSQSRVRSFPVHPPRFDIIFLFFLYAPAPTEIYTLSLHDALPISSGPRSCRTSLARRSAAGPVSAHARCHAQDRKSTRLNSSHVSNSYAVFCLKKKIEKAPRAKIQYSDRSNEK